MSLGQYEIIEQIGAGGMATVYRARQARLDRNVAIKVMHQMFAQDADFVTRFEREARIIAALDHPNIVPLYDYNEQAEQPYLVMKFVEGQTLKEVLTARTIPLEDIRHMMVTIADALTYAHEQGVLHRDVKPSNIIIDNQGYPYLMDFGLARIATQGESTMSANTMLGTPQYISPEQAKGERELDTRTDVYSLGIILYELVAGRVPFVGDSAYAIVHKHIYATVPPPSSLNPEVPPAVDGVLLHALAKEPSQRYETPNQLIKAFEAALDSSGIQKLDESRAERARQRAENLSDHTPGGGRYVTVPAPIAEGTPEPTSSVGDFLDQLGRRARELIDDVLVELDGNEVFEKIVSGVQDVIGEFSSTTSRHDGGAQSPRVIKMINNDWGTDVEAVRRRVNRRMNRRRGFLAHFAAYAIVITFLFAAQQPIQEGLAQLFAEPGFREELGTDISLVPLADINFAGVTALLWGAGLISHAMTLFYESGSRLERRRRNFLRDLKAYHGPNWPDTINERGYKKTRNHIIRRFKQHIGLLTHCISFMMWSVAAFVVWPPIYAWLQTIPEISSQAFLTEENTIPGIFMLFLALTLVLHMIGILVDMIFGSEANERTMRREMQREWERSGAYRSASIIKPKHDSIDKAKNVEPRVRLTQDGEFTKSFVNEIETDQVNATRR